MRLFITSRVAGCGLRQSDERLGHLFFIENLACVHLVPYFGHAAHIRCPHYVTPPHTTRITNDIQRPNKHHTMLATSANYQMAIPPQLLQARDTILYDIRNHILRHPKI